MSLKKHIEQFEESLLEEKIDNPTSKRGGTLTEHIAKFEESLGEVPIRKSTSKKIGFTHAEQLRLKIRNGNEIIENLKIENSNLTNQVLTLKNEKSNILKELNTAKWLENNIGSNTKQIYEDKLKKMSIVDSTKLIPTLIEVSRQKQGNEKLNWGKWLEIPENLYLFQINESKARKVFEDTNLLIDEKINYINKKKRTRAGDAPSKNYFLSFTGHDTEGSRSDLVSTQFNPNNPTGEGTVDFSGGTGGNAELTDHAPLANSGFTKSFWYRPDESYTDSFAISWKPHNNNRFEFGLKDGHGPYLSYGPNGSSVTTHWDTMLSNSGNEDMSSEFLDEDGIIRKDGTWMHIVVTYVGMDATADEDGNKLRKLYVNGRHIYGGFGEARESIDSWTAGLTKTMDQGVGFGMRTVIQASTNSETNLSKTKYNNGNKCGLDEVAIYNEAKDAAWVSSVYNAGTNYNHKDSGGSGLVGYWRFNKGSGTTAEDLSGKGNHGTLTNASYGTYDQAFVTQTWSDGSLKARGTPTWEDMSGENR